MIDRARAPGSSSGRDGVVRLTLLRCGRTAGPLCQALKEQGAWCERAEPDSWAGVRGYDTDLVILGPHPTMEDSLRLLARRPSSRGGPVLLLLDAPDTTVASRALGLGATDVVVPPHSASSILMRGRLVLRRRRTPSGLTGGFRSTAGQDRWVGASRIEIDGRRLIVPGGSVILTEREAHVLRCLRRAKGRPVSRRELLECVWGCSEAHSTVLESTVHRLRKKLEPDPSSPRFLRTVRGLGYQLELN